MSKIFFEYTINDSDDGEVTYFFLENGEYYLDTWSEEEREELNAKWRVTEKSLEFWIDNNESWNSFLAFNDNAEKRKLVEAVKDRCFNCLLLD